MPLPEMGKAMNHFKFFTTEDRGELAVLRFSRSALEDATDLQHTGRLWRFFESLRRNPRKVLLVDSEEGGFSPANVDRFWRHVRDVAPEGIKMSFMSSVSRSELELSREANAFRYFVEAVRRMDTFVIATLQGEVDFTLFGLTLACDYRVAAEDALFVNRFLDLNVSAGLVPWFLSRFIGPAMATELLLRGKLLTAGEALKLPVCTNGEDGTRTVTMCSVR